VKGLLVYVLRSDLGDCTLNGVTSPARAKGKRFYVFGPEIKNGNVALEEVKDREDSVCLLLRRRQFSGGEIHIEAVPMGAEGFPRSGGNFVYSNDSRFHDFSAHPIPVFDRFE